MDLAPNYQYCNAEFATSDKLKNYILSDKEHYWIRSVTIRHEFCFSIIFVRTLKRKKFNQKYYGKNN